MGLFKLVPSKLKITTLAWPLLWIQICYPTTFLSSPFEHLMGISNSAWLKFNFWFPSQHPKHILLQVFSIPVSGVTFIHSLSQKPKSHFIFFSFCLPLYLIPWQVLLIPHQYISWIWPLFIPFTTTSGPGHNYLSVSSIPASSLFCGFAPTLHPIAESLFCNFSQVALCLYSTSLSLPTKGSWSHLEQNLRFLP